MRIPGKMVLDSCVLIDSIPAVIARSGYSDYRLSQECRQFNNGLGQTALTLAVLSIPSLILQQHFRCLIEEALLKTNGPAFAGPVQ